MNEIPKRIEDREQGAAKIEYMNDLRPIGIYGGLKTKKGLVTFTRAQVNRRAKGRRRRMRRG